MTVNVVYIGVALVLCCLVSFVLGHRFRRKTGGLDDMRYRLLEEARVNLVSIKDAARNADAGELNFMADDVIALKAMVASAVQLRNDLQLHGLDVDDLGVELDQWPFLLGSIQRNVKSAMAREERRQNMPPLPKRPMVVNLSPIALAPISYVHEVTSREIGENGEIIVVKYCEEREIRFDAWNDEAAAAVTPSELDLNLEVELDESFALPQQSDEPGANDAEIVSDDTAAVEQVRSSSTDLETLPEGTWTSTDVPPLPSETMLRLVQPLEELDGDAPDTEQQEDAAVVPLWSVPQTAANDTVRESPGDSDLEFSPGELDDFMSSIDGLQLPSEPALAKASS